MNWYKEKANYHHKQWELALEANKEKAAMYHMQEHLNYLKMAGE